MFYSYDLLCIRRGGRYSVIWYTATHRRYPRKEDIKKVNIANTCDELIETIKIPPKSKHASKRMSLYMASVLMHGACMVYKAQVFTFLDECMLFMEKFHSSSAAKLTVLLRAMDTKRIPGAEGQPEEQRRRASRRKSKAPPEVPLERLLEMTLQPPPLPEAMDEAAMRMRLETTEAAYTSKDLTLLSFEEARHSRESSKELGRLPQDQLDLFGVTDPILLEQMVQAGESLGEPILPKPEVPSVRPPTPPAALAAPGAPAPPDTPAATAALAAPAAPVVADAPIAPDSPLPLPPAAAPTEDASSPPPASAVPPTPPTTSPALAPPPAAVVDVEDLQSPERAESRLQVPEIEVLPPTPRRARSALESLDVGVSAAKRPRLFPRLPIYKEDERTRIGIEAIRMFALGQRIDRAQDEVIQVEERAIVFTPPDEFGYLRRNVEYVRKRASPEHLPELSIEVALHPPPGAASLLSGTSHLSPAQIQEVVKAEGQIATIPELAESISAILPEAIEEGVSHEQIPLVEDHEMPPPPVVQAPFDVTGAADAAAASSTTTVPTDATAITTAAAATVTTTTVTTTPATLLPLVAEISEKGESLEQLAIVEEPAAIEPWPEQMQTEDTSPEKQQIIERTNWVRIKDGILEALQEQWAAGNGKTTFDKICPPQTTSRMKAAISFNALLHMEKDKVVSMQQENTFGTIFINSREF